jgi:hypothetical protein
MQTPQLRDGPYVFKNINQWQALWVCDGIRQSYNFPPLTEKRVIEKCGLRAQLLAEPAKRPEIEYPAVEQLAVFSDVHGQFDLMKRLLIANNIVDEKGNWSFGKGHLVVVGDVFDRGDKVTESLWLLYQLEQQAAANGGQVHYLIGNHEVMVLNNDLRYLNAKYLEVESILGQSISVLYDIDTLLGEWIRTRNVLVKIGDMLFTHGGLNPQLAVQERSLAEINQIFTTHLIKDENHPREGFAKYLHKSHGPVWYRGYFREPKVTAQQVSLLKSTYDINHIVVGHTTQKQVLGIHDNAIIAVDSGIKHGENGELLLVNKGHFYRGLLDGSRILLH